MRKKYNHYWPDEANDLTIELAAFKRGITVEQGGLGKLQHFINCVDALFNHEESLMRFDWNPFAMRIFEAACEHKYLAVAGCAGSSKTESVVMWGLINYIADPQNTTVLLTSTSLKDSRLRGWGRMTKYWQFIPGLPGKLVDSQGMIKFMDPATGETSSDSGIFLLAGDPSKEKEAIGKMIGFKNRTIIVLADELAELSPAILEASEGNLESGKQYFQFIGLSNPASYYDPFGELARPKDGWGSITPSSTEWETDRGYCIRLDGELSPNVLAGKTLYHYMITKEEIDAKRQSLGENSPQFWRMYRGFWCPTGTAAGLYTEQDIMQYGGEERGVDWADGSSPVRVAFLDTAFSDGGDRAVVQLGSIGKTRAGKRVLLLDRGFIRIKTDLTKKNEPLNFQIANRFKEICIENGVRISNAGVDATGGGAPFADILSVIWGTGFYRCFFGGSPSDRIASSSDERTCKEAFYDRVSEIWGVGVELMRTGQLKGLYFELIQELTGRLYKTHKRGTGMCIAVESKKDMRRRTGKSPDIADAALGLVDLCRERLMLDSVEGDSLSFGEDGPDTWDKQLMISDMTYTSEDEAKLDRFFGNSGFIPLNW